MELDYRLGFRYLDKKHEEKIEDLLWEQWLMLYPHMNEKVSFSEYKKKLENSEGNKPKKYTKEEKKQTIERFEKYLKKRGER